MTKPTPEPVYNPLLDKPAPEKFRLSLQAFKDKYGRDARGGGASFVAHAAYVEQLLKDLPELLVQLEKPIIIGELGADIVFRFEAVPVRVRMHAKAGLWLIDDRILPSSTREERQVASAIRLAAHQGKLIRVVN